MTLQRVHPLAPLVSNRESLVYWLEFKNDDEFPAIFGSIAGGSALKFGLYRRKETGAWMTGSPQSHLKGWEQHWEPMRAGGYLAIGWATLGDLSAIERNQESKSRVQALMKEHYNDNGGWAQEIFAFVAVIQPGDVVLAFEGNTILGIGRVTGPYKYDPTTPETPHRRPVEWLTCETWSLPHSEAQARTIRVLRAYVNQVEIERHLFDAAIKPSPPPPRPPDLQTTPSLSGIPGRIQAILERKGQVILYGPPGTGKTY